MSRKFWYLTKMSLFKKVKSKWFLGVNILFALLIIFLCNIDSLITFFGGDFDEGSQIVILDETKEVGSSLKSLLLSSEYNTEDNTRYQVSFSNKSLDDEKKLLNEENDNRILIVLEKDATHYLKAKIISHDKISSLDYQILVQNINQVKSAYALSLSNINPQELEQISSPVEIEREVLSTDKTASENMDLVMNTVFPIIIMPVFMLTIFLVQMIGADICEEKSTRSMEVIISNVSAKVHFASKVVAANLFVLIQGCLLFLFVLCALLIRNALVGKNTLSSVSTFVKDILGGLAITGFIDKLWYFIPLFLLLIIVSFIAYSFLAGILASITTNMEDFQQIQTPMMIISLLGYYLSIMAGAFEGSLFIRILSYVPFISSLLSPALFILGQISLLDVFLSILITLFVIFLFLRYGMRIYKAGILNYSNEKIWTRFAKTIRNKDI